MLDGRGVYYVCWLYYWLKTVATVSNSGRSFNRVWCEGLVLNKGLPMRKMVIYNLLVYYFYQDREGVQ